MCLVREPTVDVQVSGSGGGPVQLEMKSPAAPAQSKRDPTFAGLATWLSGAFVLLTTLLTAVGSYTGGVARLMRNDADKFQDSLIYVLIAVFLGVLAGEFAKADVNFSWLQVPLLLAAVGCFFYAMNLAISSAAYSVTLKDRPSLNAQLVENGRLWTLKGTASAGGLQASQRMQILGYAVPDGGGEPKRIFFVTTGPNSDGVASGSFEAPLPKGKYESIVVTANHGILPRDCAGNRAWYVESDPVELKEAQDFQVALQNACVTLAPPPQIPAQ